LATLVCDTVLQNRAKLRWVCPQGDQLSIVSAMYAISATGDSPKGIDDGDTGLLVAVTATKRR